MISRLERIKSKGFNMPVAQDDMPLIKDNGPIDFSKIKVGAKTLSDAVIDYGDLKKVNRSFADKTRVLEAMDRGDVVKMREISNFYYKTSGIYTRLCKYFAYMYRYDWMVVPYVKSDKMKKEKIVEGFDKVLTYLDDFELKRFFMDAALKVMRHGCYYGYLIETPSGTQVQELPPNYCRSRYNVAGNPAVEFNMKFFDDYYATPELRNRVLKLFPPEFSKGYELFKKGRLLPDFPGDQNGWYLLDPVATFKFNLDGEDYPPLMSVIPAIIDLDEAQGLDKKKLKQQLLKIIIQKMPIDKNGELIFDIDETQALHNNAVRMLGKAIGTDVLTTFADVDVADMAESSSTTTDDTMTRTKEAVFDQAGVPQLIFNSSTNIALNNSILNDETSMYTLLLQFESFINKFLLNKFNKTPKKICYKTQLLTTTVYNYKDLAKLYKEQTQLGYSKFLPQIALGQSQRAILASANFENEVLDLVNVFIPPLMSSTMNSDFLTGKSSESSSSKSSSSGTSKSDEGAGRKELDDNEKSDKTIQNRESKVEEQ